MCGCVAATEGHLFRTGRLLGCATGVVAVVVLCGMWKSAAAILWVSYVSPARRDKPEEAFLRSFFARTRCARAGDDAEASRRILNAAPHATFIFLSTSRVQETQRDQELQKQQQPKRRSSVQCSRFCSSPSCCITYNNKRLAIRCEIRRQTMPRPRRKQQRTMFQRSCVTCSVLGQRRAAKKRTVEAASKAICSSSRKCSHVKEVKHHHPPLSIYQIMKDTPCHRSSITPSPPPSPPPSHQTFFTPLPPPLLTSPLKVLDSSRALPLPHLTLIHRRTPASPTVQRDTPARASPRRPRTPSRHFHVWRLCLRNGRCRCRGPRAPGQRCTDKCRSPTRRCE